MRASGILMPVFSLPSRYGIGTFSKESFKFVDFLSEAGQKYWQILPLGPTGYGDSPYQSFSTFAGNPYFIDLDEFVEAGFLKASECKNLSAGDGNYIDYEKLYNTRFVLLRKAYERSHIRDNQEFNRFASENAFWLDSYALYMAVKNSFGGRPWTEWDTDIRLRKPEAVEEYSRKFADEMDFYRFQQFYFLKQWLKLKGYANSKGVEIIGDIPIYVAFDSADAWGNPELFDLNSDNFPNAVAGCPPDYFSATGQLWGNPLYSWDYHRNTGYDWWIKRISHCFKLYDVVRIDHFRGFDEFYAIPYGNTTAEIGEWRKGPGYELFETIKNRLGDKPIIAEDLGLLTDSVRELVKRTGYPGMKILEFAFDSDNKSEYLPHMVGKNSIIYTGTHDNETARGYYARMRRENPGAAAYIRDYTGVSKTEDMAWGLIKLAYGSVCDTAIIPMQDFLNLGNEGRINTPSTLGNNWSWRMSKGALTKPLAKKIRALKEIYAR